MKFGIILLLPLLTCECVSKESSGLKTCLATKTRGNSNSSYCRIVGGYNAYPHSSPHQVSIQKLVGNNWMHHCGGSIISCYQILTAAHCFYGETSALRVVAGEQDLTINEGTEQEARIARITIHDSYNPTTFDYDFAIVKLTQAFTFNSYVRSIDLPPASFTPSRSCKSTGWGATSPDGNSSIPATLQEVVLPIVSRDACRRYFIGQVTDTMICAGYPGKGTCTGDSGGPLVCNGVLAGVVSSGYYPCGSNPSLFSETTKANLRYVNDRHELLLDSLISVHPESSKATLIYFGTAIWINNVRRELASNKCDASMNWKFQ